MDLMVSETAHLVFPIIARSIPIAKPSRANTRSAPPNADRPRLRDKAARTGLRIVDLVNRPGSNSCSGRKSAKQRDPQGGGAKPLSFQKVHEAYRQPATASSLSSATPWFTCTKPLSRPRHPLRGRQAPSSTSITAPIPSSLSNTTAGGACTGSGIRPSHGPRGGSHESLHHAGGEGPLPSENEQITNLLHSMDVSSVHHWPGPTLRLVRCRRHPPRRHGQRHR